MTKIISTKTNAGWCRATLNGKSGIGPFWLDALADLARCEWSADERAVIEAERAAQYERLGYGPGGWKNQPIPLR